MAKKKINDAGHEETEKVLEEIEKRISEAYRQAEKEVEEKLDKYLKGYIRRNEKKLEEVKQGVITQAQYEQWLVGQMAIGKRWQDMRDNLAQDFTNAEQIARRIAGEEMPNVYAINMNYATYQIERDTRINTSFTLYDRGTVERLAKADENIVPVPGKKVSMLINEGKAQRWNNQQIQSVMMQSILQGESIPKIAKRLAKAVGETDRKASIRNARTLTTGVQNAGRIAGYKRAEKMGIDLGQQWLAVMDGRTRHEHRILDGQVVEVGGKFEVEGEKIAYPGDPSASPHLIYNCRCTLVGAIKGLDNTVLHDHNDALGDMTYEEWKYEKTPKVARGKKTSKASHNDDGIQESDAYKIQTYDGLSDYVEKNMGMKVDQSIGLLDFKSVRESVEGIEYIQQEFPKASDAFKKIKVVRGDGNSIMQADYDGSISYCGDVYRERERVLDSLIDEKGIANQSTYSTGAHEAAHMLEKALIDLDNDGDEIIGQYMWDNCIYAHDVVNEAFTELKKTGLYDNLTLNEMKREICEYALENDSETLAYGVEDAYANGDTAKQLSRAIWKVLKRELG